MTRWFHENSFVKNRAKKIVNKLFFHVNFTMNSELSSQDLKSKLDSMYFVAMPE